MTGRMVGRWQGGRERLFREERDYRRFLERLEEAVGDYGVRLYLFCLMSNHFHLVLETPQANLSQFMQRLSTAYTIYFNLRHGRHGHVMDGRFKTKLVSGDDYLLRLSRYVHQNPVWVASWARRPIKERITRLRAYRWSSYAGYAGYGPQWRWVDEGPILAMMSGRGSQKRRTYRGFVERGLAEGDEEFREALKAPGLAVGDEIFRQWVEKQWGRAVAARFLVRYAGQTQRQVASWLEVGTGTAVGSQLQRLEQWEKEDRKLRSIIDRVERSLEAEPKTLGPQYKTKKGRKK